MILEKKHIKQVYKSELINVIDGDTIDVKIEFGLGFFCNARIRLKGIDAPEIKKVKKESSEYKNGTVAKYKVKKWFAENGTCIYVSAESRGLYGRWLGEIWADVGENSLNDYMIKECYKTSYKEWKHQEPLKKIN